MKSLVDLDIFFRAKCLLRPICWLIGHPVDMSENLLVAHCNRCGQMEDLRENLQ